MDFLFTYMQKKKSVVNAIILNNSGIITNVLLYH